MQKRDNKVHCNARLNLGTKLVPRTSALPKCHSGSDAWTLSANFKISWVLVNKIPHNATYRRVHKASALIY